MIVITFLALIFGISHFFDLPAKLTELAKPLHHFCLQSLPQQVENLQSLEALVCGKNMQEIELQHLLVQSSLIHIFIVSGSHFLFLHKILAKLPITRICPLLPLSMYALVTLCQAPALRSLIFLLLLEIFEHYKLRTSSVISTFLSGLFCVALFPDWVWSRSLQMSLMAALVLNIASEMSGEKKASLPALFLTQSALFLAMGFCVWGFGNLHPLSILLNLLVAPLIGGILFPLALGTLIFPPLGGVFDGAMTLLIWILKKTSLVLGSPANSGALPLIWQWGLLLVLLVGSHHVLTERRRAKTKYV